MFDGNSTIVLWYVSTNEWIRSEYSSIYGWQIAIEELSWLE